MQVFFKPLISCSQSAPPTDQIGEALLPLARISRRRYDFSFGFWLGLYNPQQALAQIQEPVTFENPAVYVLGR